jgi:hypothetical protein
MVGRRFARPVPGSAVLPAFALAASAVVLAGVLVAVTP